MPFLRWLTMVRCLHCQTECYNHPMISRVLILLFMVLLALPAWSQAQNKRAPLGPCFGPKEAEAEAEVRTGIQIRETLRRCAQTDPDGQTYLSDWYAFDKENGDRFKAAVELRRQAISRIYPNRTQAQQWETDAAVATMKPLQTNESICKSTYDIIDRIKAEKWPGFKYYSRLQERILASELPMCKR